MKFYKTETGCKAEDKCLFPLHKVDEQPNTKPKKEIQFPTKEEERDHKDAVAVVKSVSQLGCVMRKRSSF